MKFQISNYKSFTPLDACHLTGQANFKFKILNYLPIIRAALFGILIIGI